MGMWELRIQRLQREYHLDFVEWKHKDTTTWVLFVKSSITVICSRKYIFSLYNN